MKSNLTIKKIESLMKRTKMLVYTPHGHRWITVLQFSMYPKDWEKWKDANLS